MLFIFFSFFIMEILVESSWNNKGHHWVCHSPAVTWMIGLLPDKWCGHSRVTSAEGQALTLHWKWRVLTPGMLAQQSRSPCSKATIEEYIGFGERNPVKFLCCLGKSLGGLPHQNVFHKGRKFWKVVLNYMKLIWSQTQKMDSWIFSCIITYFGSSWPSNGPAMYKMA